MEHISTILDEIINHHLTIEDMKALRVNKGTSIVDALKQAAEIAPVKFVLEGIEVTVQKGSDLDELEAKYYKDYCEEYRDFINSQK